MSNLQILAQHRDALLLAEAIGWLHDYRKCSEEHLQTQAPGSKTQALPRTELPNRQADLQNISLALPTVQSSSRTVTSLLDDRTWNQDTLGQFLSRCHNTAHFDKQEPVGGEQNYPGTQISSAFGFEKPVGTNLTARLWGLPWRTLATLASDRQDLREKISTLFAQAVADSRRPINEVDLWSWGSLVGALYKSALAGSLLTGRVPSAQNLRWRLLSVRVDGLGYISNVARVPDLLARQKLLSDALDQVRTLLEVEYPLGSEVYRDQDGSLFIVPDVPDLLEIPDDQGTILETRIIQTFTEKVEGDLLPVVTLEQVSWWGQDPNWSRNVTTTNDRLPDVKGMLARPVATQADVRFIETSWQGKEGNWELCSVCRLRPMREGAEACETCEQRRGSRIETWENNPAQTIWMDEIADHNDRVALIVGKFGLDNWLSGDLVQTMLVKADPATNTFIPKNPSPARLRRVWETCRRFWTETVEQEILAKHVYSQGDALRCVRQLIIPDQKTGWRENVPYDGTVDGKPISLLWRAQAQHFVTISNLQLSGEIKPGQVIRLDDPDNPGRQFTVTVQGTMPASGAMGTYAPYLPLLVSPDQFLALVPAAEALEIAGKIRAEYARQFGKVQNRLPLFLGLVFFQRKTPLLAVMDTARRMLAGEFANSKWQIVDTPQNDRKTVTLSLEQAGQRITLQVPLVMGDGTTEDVWYPYFELVGQPAAHHTYRFQRDGAWWVHVKTLQAGETVRLTPSRFAYLFLESTAQRFRFNPQKDVLLLNDLPRLMEMWKAICRSPKMSDTKLQAIHALFESKLQEWKLGEPTSEHPITDETFCHLVETTMRRDKVQDIPVEDVLNGLFRRCLDLYLHILKRRVSDETKQEEQYEQQTV
jgi:hypothetical protein